MNFLICIMQFVNLYKNNKNEAFCYRFIAFGAGAGANVFLRFALAHPEKVESMVLINPTARRAGWVEWGYLKLAVRYLHSGVTNRSVYQTSMSVFLCVYFYQIQI